MKKEEEEFEKIGKQNLDLLFEIDQDLKKEINEFNQRCTKININFIKIKKDVNYYQKVKILGKIYGISNKSNIELNIKELKSFNGFETKEIKELINDEGNNNIQFTININLHQSNNYNVILDKINEKCFSVDINYYSNQQKLLPNNINIYNKDFSIIDSLYNMKRIVFININVS